MIYIALGSNLPTEKFGEPVDNCEAALEMMPHFGIYPTKRSRWYKTEPVPASDQPWFINGVVEVETKLDPYRLLQALHRIEANFGRLRRIINETRPIDLDLLAYNQEVIETPNLLLPHPRIAERRFVLQPLMDIAPGWIHPIHKVSVATMLAKTPDNSKVLSLGERARA
jgi:2-amino-4-hydroxy-6-hydroxymethyldihydropteridine diphosphokinase